MDDKNLKMLRSTIRRDKHVRRWFLGLLAANKVREEFYAAPGSSALYKNFSQSLKKQKLSLINCVLLVTIFSLSRQPLWLAAGGIMFGLFILRLNSSAKNLAEAAAWMVSRDFPDTDMARTTLYQIGEIYSRKYRVPSLVDALYAFDSAAIAAILISLVFNLSALSSSLSIFKFFSVFILLSLAGVALSFPAVFKKIK